MMHPQKFLGYDPGGKGKHGVAVALIAADGSFVEEPKMAVLESAKDVQEWLNEHLPAAALGIDTLLAWSISGRRLCDDALRHRYPDRAPTVIAQNSLYSAMTINGMLIAKVARDLGLPLVESHPKLLLAELSRSDKQGSDLLRRHQELINKATSSADKKKADDMADSLVAAWCASRWWHGCWTENLFDAFPTDLLFPAGETVYPWPEPITPVHVK